LKKEDLILKLKEFEEKLKFEKEDKRKQIELKNKEIEEKDKLIFSIGGKNRKLLAELEELKKEVDDKLDKIGMKQLAEKEKEIQKKKKEQPYEQVLKVKEKELKNALNLLDIIKKDKDNLQKNLEDNADAKKVRALEDRLKEEENKYHQLEIEVKLSKSLRDEHNKCEQIRENYEKEKRNLLSEIKYYKDKTKEITQKMKEEEERSNKMHNYLANMNNPNPNSNEENSNNNSNSLNLPNINNFSGKRASNNNLARSKEINLEKYWKLLDSADKNSQYYTDGRLLEKSPPGKESSKNNKYINKFDNKKNFSDRQKFSVSLSHKTFKVDNEENAQKLFGMEEKEILLKILPSNEVEKLEKKFEMVQKNKIALEKKFQLDTKLHTKKITELEERLEYTNLHNKELEQRNKILGYQINEHKNENKIVSRKFNELTSNISATKLNLKQKEEENKMLVLKIQEMQKSINELNSNNHSNNMQNNSDTDENNNQNEEHNENEHMDNEEGEDDDGNNDDEN